MTTKVLSLATAIVSLDVYLQSQLHANDPLFLFASNNFVVNGLMVLLAFLTVALAFRKKFTSWIKYAACSAAALLLTLIGLLGGLYSNMDYAFSNVLLPFDYLIILMVGVIFGICALSYDHAPAPESVKQFKPQMISLFNRLVLSVPKIPHSPTAGNGGHMRHA